METHIISKRDYLIATGLIVLAFLVRTPYFSYPPQPVFDEAYFTNFGIQTIKGETDIDIHPPFMRLIFAGIIKTAGFNALDQKIISGENYGNFPYAPLRLVTVVAGSLLAGVIYLLSKKIYGSVLLAVLPGIFVIFDGILITYSRLILYDTYILFFGFLSVLLLWLSLDSSNRRWKILLFMLAGISMGLAASIKWSGLAFLASGFILLLIKGKIKYFIILAFLAITAYFGIFLTLYGAGRVKNIYEIQKKMLHAQISIREHHPAQSRPWQWPLSYDGPVLWNSGKDIIKLSPNVFSWTAAFVSIVISLYLLARDRSPKLLFLFGSFFANYLPFFLISRPIYIYHYFPALLFGYLLTPFLLIYLSEILFGNLQNRHIYALMALDLILYLAVIPFIY